MESDQCPAQSDNTVDAIDELNHAHFEKVYGTGSRARERDGAAAHLDGRSSVEPSPEAIPVSRGDEVRADGSAGEPWDSLKAAWRQGVETLRRLG